MKDNKNLELKYANICKCFLLFKDKYGIDSKRAREYLSKEFFIASSTLSSHILSDREHYSSYQLEDNEKCLLLRTLEKNKVSINPLTI